jgi:hypothetical protein
MTRRRILMAGETSGLPVKSAPSPEKRDIPPHELEG